MNYRPHTHIANFQPGCYEVNYFNYTRSAVSSFADESFAARRWTKLIDSNETAAVVPFASSISRELYELVDELKKEEINSLLMKHWLDIKLTQALILTLNDQEVKQRSEDKKGSS